MSLEEHAKRINERHTAIYNDCMGILKRIDSCIFQNPTDYEVAVANALKEGMDKLVEKSGGRLTRAMYNQQLTGILHSLQQCKNNFAGERVPLLLFCAEGHFNGLQENHETGLSIARTAITGSRANSLVSGSTPPVCRAVSLLTVGLFGLTAATLVARQFAGPQDPVDSASPVNVIGSMLGLS